jgi:hypothetical protein
VDRNLDSSATYVNLVVDLLDEEDKKKDLLSAWNGFKIEVRPPSSYTYRRRRVETSFQQQGQFPELVPTSIGTEYAGIASGRVLNAKHQTTRSSRPKRQVLDRVAAAASSSSRPQPPARNFPALPPTSKSSPKPITPPSRPQQKQRTPWLNNGQGSSSLSRPPDQQPVSISKPLPKRAAPPPPLSKSAFPELPAVVSKRPPKQFISGNKSLKNILGDAQPAQPAWGQGPSTLPSSPPLDPDPEPTTTKGKKGKGKQKQTLFTLGSFPT